MGVLPTVAPGNPGHPGDHNDIHRLLDDIATDTDYAVTRYSRGLLSARPAAGRPGSFYEATDVGVIYFDNGATWSSIGEALSDFVLDLVSTTLGLLLPACRVGKSAPQSIPNDGSNFTALTWDDETTAGFYDNAALHSIASNTHRFTSVRDGVYFYKFGTRWEPDPDNYRRMQVTKNGATAVIDADERASAGSINMSTSVSGEVFLEVGDWIQCGVAQNSGGARDINPTGSFAAFSYRTALS